MAFRLVQNQQVVDERGVWVESVDRFHVRCRYGECEAVVEVDRASRSYALYASSLSLRGGTFPFDPVEAIRDGLLAMGVNQVEVIQP